MDAHSLSKKLLAFLLQLVFALYESEAELVFQLVAQVKAEGLSGDDARREVLRRFRKHCGDTLRDSLVNFLIEAAIVAGKA
jgi:hypothetical protein